jgi:hypothetical protein
MNDTDTWGLRQLWQFAKNRGYSVKLEDERIWFIPNGESNPVFWRSFPDTHAGVQAARAWLNQPAKLDSVQPEAKSEKVQERVAGGVGQAIGWVIGFVIASAIVGGVVSWWNDNHWSSGSETNFLTSCEAQGAGVAYCECALHQVEQQYGPKESDSLAGNSAVANQIASYCVGR